MGVMENNSLQMPSILHGSACFLNQLVEMIVGLKVEERLHRAGPAVRNDFELFNANAILTLGFSQDLAAAAHGCTIKFSEDLDGHAIDGLSEGNLQVFGVARLFFREHDAEDLALDVHRHFLAYHLINADSAPPGQDRDAVAEFREQPAAQIVVNATSLTSQKDECLVLQVFRFPNPAGLGKR